MVTAGPPSRHPKKELLTAANLFADGPGGAGNGGMVMALKRSVTLELTARTTRREGVGRAWAMQN